jgi:hypothetical protein
VIFIGAVTVVLAVRLIVLALIADRSAKSEPIMTVTWLMLERTAGVMLEQIADPVMRRRASEDCRHLTR